MQSPRKPPDTSNTLPPNPSWDPTSLLGCWPTPRGPSTSVPERATDGLQEALEDGTTVIHVLCQVVGQIQKILISVHHRGRWGEAASSQNQGIKVTGQRLMRSVSRDIAKTPENPKSASA